MGTMASSTVPFLTPCKVITNEDRASCIRMTNKFIHQAIFVAFGINNEEISIKELVKNIKNDYDPFAPIYYRWLTLLIHSPIFREVVT